MKTRSPQPKLRNSNAKLLNLKKLLDQGEALMNANDFESASGLYAQAVMEFPDYSICYSCLGAALIKLEQMNEAEAVLRRAIELNPKDEIARTNMAAIYQHNGESKEALMNCLELIQINPNSAITFNNLGCAFSALEMYKEAKEAYQTSLQIDENYCDCLINLGKLYSDSCEPDKAIELYEKALKIFEENNDPRQEFVKYYLSFDLLSKGLLKRGWENYEHGFSTTVPRLGRRLPNRIFNIPKWQGQIVAGKKLLIWREQGIGDEIRMYSILNELPSKEMHITVECDTRLIQVLSNSFPNIHFRQQIILEGELASIINNEFDFHCPTASLPLLFRNDPESFSSTSPFIVPNKKRAEEYRLQLASKSNKIKVGICWRSGLMHSTRNMHMTNLIDWEPILKDPRISVVNLQYGECEAEIAEAEKMYDCEIIRLPNLDLKDDLEGTFALTSTLDYVITVGTAVLEIAGALNIPTIALLKDGWIFFGDKSKYPWYSCVTPCVSKIDELLANQLVEAHKILIEKMQCLIQESH